MKQLKKDIRAFERKLRNLGFRKMTLEEILANNQWLDLEFPATVSDRNHRQDQWIFTLRHGYSVVVITTLIDGQLTPGLVGRVLITQGVKRLMTWKFHKGSVPRLFLAGLSAHAGFARNLIRNRPFEKGTITLMKLRERRVNRLNKKKDAVKTYFVLEWVEKKKSHPISYVNRKYLEDLSPEDQKVIMEKKRKAESYLDRWNRKYRTRDIKKTATVGSAKK